MLKQLPLKRSLPLWRLVCFLFSAHIVSALVKIKQSLQRSPSLTLVAPIHRLHDRNTTSANIFSNARPVGSSSARLCSSCKAKARSQRLQMRSAFQGQELIFSQPDQFHQSNQIATYVILAALRLMPHRTKVMEDGLGDHSRPESAAPSNASPLRTRLRQNSTPSVPSRSATTVMILNQID